MTETDTPEGEPPEDEKAKAAKAAATKAAQKAWIRRWGSTPIEYDPDTNRWAIFEDPDWRPYPGDTRPGHKRTAHLAGHVMGPNAMAVIDEHGDIDHWRRYDPDAGIWIEMGEGAVAALVSAVLGEHNASQFNGAMRLLAVSAMGAPGFVHGDKLARAVVMPLEKLDAQRRYRPYPSGDAFGLEGIKAGVADLETNTVIEDPDEIAALKLYPTKRYQAPMVPDCDEGAKHEGGVDLTPLGIPDKMGFMFEGFQGNHPDDPPDAKTDEAYFWEEEGHSEWGKPNRRILIYCGPSGCGKSTRLKALEVADGDFGNSGRVSDIAKETHEPRFAIRRSWCDHVSVYYDDGPNGTWHWNSILQGSGGAKMTCESKNEKKYLKLPAITTPRIAMTPDRLQWIGMHTEGGAPERSKIIFFQPRSKADHNPTEVLDRWGWITADEMAEEDIGLRMGIMARKMREASRNRKPPKESPNVLRNLELVLEESEPPLEAWAKSGAFAFGGHLSFRSWEDAMRHAAGQNPEWRLNEPDPWRNKGLTLTVPKKGRGSEEIDSTDFAHRIRATNPRWKDVKSKPARVKGSANRFQRMLCGAGLVGVLPPEPDDGEPDDGKPEPPWENYTPDPPPPASDEAKAAAERIREGEAAKPPLPPR